MAKTQIIICSMILFFLISCKEKEIVGEYENYFNERIVINPDSTFRYSWRTLPNYSDEGWVKGKWIVKNDTLTFSIVPIYDKVKVKTQYSEKDTIRLSLDDRSDTLNNFSSHRENMDSGRQDVTLKVPKLYFENDKLYQISSNGNLKIAKRKFSKNGKYLLDPWYFKVKPLPNTR